MKRLLLPVQAVLVASSNAAVASQGPGTAMGSASATLQTAMAVLVYGICAAVLAIALVRAARR